MGVEALPLQKTGTASLLVPAETSLVYLEDMFPHFGQKNTEGRVTTRINVWTCGYPLLTRWETKGVS